MRSLSRTSTYRLLIAAALAALASAAPGHPSRGIVADRQGRVYFSDLVRVWRIDGDRLRLVRANPGTHTHAIILGARGDVVWEESAYRPADQAYVETIWQLTGNRLSRRFGPMRNPPRGLGIARDRQGCTFHAEQAGRGGPIVVHRWCPGKRPLRLFGTAEADARIRRELISDVGGVALASDGSFVFRHGPTVRAVTPAGRARVLADGLAPENFGIALDSAGRLLVAEHRNRRVLRIAGARRQVVAVSERGWAPTGVAARGNAVLVLEASEHRPGLPMRMRVRSVEPGRPARLLAQVTVPQP